MSGSNDTRIVEMQFDNKDFEKNISTSQQSLERFKKELDFKEASNGVKKFTDSFNEVSSITKFTDNIQKLTDKFTGLGNVGEFIMSKIRNSWENMASSAINFAKSLTTVQTQVGFTKYETLNKSVQTLRSATGKEEQEIYRVLDRLNKYTDETSYDFAQGVTSISQLVSSGAATLSQAETTVEGFYNYAAKAGADVQKASTALQYSMVQAFQRGYLDWMNAKELSQRSMLTADFKNTLLETAVELGTVTEVEGKYYTLSKSSTKQKQVEVNATDLFNDSLKEQWATSEVLNATLAKYADTTTDFGKEAYAAAQRCTTFTDALNAWKDMLSTGWMQSYRTIFGDLGDAMQLFSGICNKVSDALGNLSATRNDILKSWKISGGKDSLWSLLVGEFESPDEGIKFKGEFGLLDVVIGLGETISNSFWEAFTNSLTEDEKAASEELAARAREMYSSEIWDKDKINELYFGARLAKYTKNIKDFVTSIREFFNTLDSKTGKTRLEKIQEIFTSVFTTIRTIGSLINGIFGFFGNIASQLEPSFDAVLNFLDSIGLSVQNAEEKLTASGKIKAFFDNLAESIRPLTTLINDVVTDVLGFLTKLVTGADEAAEASENLEKTTDNWQKVKDFFSDLAGIIRSVVNPIKQWIGDIFDAFTSGVKDGSNSAGKGESTIDFFSMLRDVLVSVGEAVGWVIGLAGELISKFIKWGNESGVFAAIWNTIVKIFTSVREILEKIIPSLENFFTQIKDMISDLFENGFNKDSLSGALIKLKTAFKDLGKDLIGMLPGIGADFKSFFDQFFALFKQKKTESIAESAKKAFKFDPNMIIAMGGMSDVGALKKSTAKLEKEGDKIATFGDAFLKWFDGFWSDVEGLFENYKRFMGTDNGLEAILLGVLGFLAVRGIYRFFKNATNAIGALGKGITDFSKAISKNLEVSTETKGQKLLRYAEAIGIVAAAVIGVAQLPFYKAVQGLGTIGAIMLGMVVFTKKMNKAMAGVEWKKIGSMAAMFVTIGIAIGMIVDAMKPILDLQGKEAWPQFQRFLWGLVSVFVTLGLFMGAVNGVNASWKNLSGLIAVAISVNLIIGALSAIAELHMNDEVSESLDYAIDAIKTVMLLMALVGAASKGGGIKDAGIFLGGMGVLIWSLQSLTRLVGDPKWFEKLLLMFGSLTIMMTLFAAFAGIINHFNISIKDSGLNQLAWLALSVGILVQMLLPITDLVDDAKGWEKFGMMMATLYGIVIALGLFSRLMGKNSFKGKGFGQIILLALGIASLILVLSSVGGMEWEQIGKMGAVYGGVIAGLLILVGGMRLIEKKLGGGMKKSFSFGTMIAFVIGLAALIAVLKPVGNMDTDALTKMGASFITLIIGLAGAVALIQKTSNKFTQALGSVFIIVALVHSMGRLMTELKEFASLDIIKYSNAMKAFGGMILGMTAAVAIIQKSSSDIWSAIGSVFVIGALVASFIFITDMLKSLTGFSSGDLRKTKWFFMSVLGTLTSSVKSINKSQTDIGQTSLHLLELYFIVELMGELITILKPLGNESWGSMAKMFIGFELMIGALTSATKKISKSVSKSQQDGAIGMLGTIGIMAAIAGSMYVFGVSLGKIKDVSIGQIAAFGLVLKMLLNGVISKTIKSAKKPVDAGAVVTELLSMTGVIVAIGIFGSALNNIQDVSSGKILVFAVALRLIMGIVSKNAKLASKSSDVGMIVDQILSMLLMVVAISTFGDALNKVKDVSTGKIIVFSLALGLLMNIASKNAKNARKKSDTKAVIAQLGSMLLLIVAVGAIADAMNKVKDISTGQMIGFAAGIGILMLSMAATVKSLSKLGVGGSVLGIATMAGGLAAMLLVFGKVGAMALQSVGNALPAFSEGLTGLGEAVGSFGKDASGIKGSDLSGAFDILKEIGKISALLTAENIGIGIFTALTGVEIQEANMNQFASDISVIGNAIGSFAESVSGKDFSNVDKATGALKAISEVQGVLELYKLGDAALSWFAKLTGVNISDDTSGLSGFAEDVKAIAPVLADIGETLSGTDFTSFEKASDGILKLGELSGQLQAMEIGEIALGIFSKMTGISTEETSFDGNGLSRFCDDLAVAAPELARAGSSLEGVSFDNFETAANCIETMGKALTNITVQNVALEILGKLTGCTLEPTSLNQFCSDLAIAAPALQDAGSALDGIETTGFETAATVIEKLGQAMTGITITDISFAIFEGITGNHIDKTSMEQFCSDLAKAAPELAKAGGSLSGLNSQNFQNAADALSGMVTIQNALNNETIKMELFKALIPDGEWDVQNIEGFTKQIVAAVPSLETLSKEMKGKDFSSLSGAAEALKGMAEVQKILNDDAYKAALASGTWDLLGILKFEGGEYDATTLEEFGNQLIPLGQAMAKFADSVSFVEMADGRVHSIDTDGFRAAIESVKVLGELQTVLPSVGSFFSWVTGEQQTISDFGNGLYILGYGLRSIFDSLYEVKNGKAPDRTDLQMMADLFDGFSGLMLAVKTNGGKLPDLDFSNISDQIKQLISISTPENEKDIAAISGMLQNISSAYEAFHSFLSIDTIYDMIEAIAYDNSMISQLSTVGTSIVDGISSGLTNAESGMTDAITSLLTSAATSTSYDYEMFKRIGVAIRNIIAYEGIAAEGSTSLSDAIASILSIASDASQYDFSQFTTIGENVSAGIAEGITNGTGAVGSAMAAVVSAAVTAAMRGFDEHSPSKVMQWIGNMAVKGLSNGLTNGIIEAAESSTALVDATINPFDSLTKTMEKISDVGVVDYLKDMTGNTVNKIGTVIQSISEKGLGETVKETISPIVDTAKELIGLSGNGGNSAATATKPTTTKDMAAKVSSGVASKSSSSSSYNDDLAARIDALGDRIASMQVMLDGKALVGQISEDLDQSIGRLVVKYRRGGG